jgi:hypothetical protein
MAAVREVREAASSLMEIIRGYICHGADHIGEALCQRRRVFGSSSNAVTRVRRTA